MTEVEAIAERGHDNPDAVAYDPAQHGLYLAAPRRTKEL
jgi:hypothetical protein